MTAEATGAAPPEAAGEASPIAVASEDAAPAPDPSVDAASPDQAQSKALQRRTLFTLMAAVVFGGAGTAGGFSAIAVLVEEISGSESLGGYVASGFAVGSASAAVPLAKLMERKGRRVGLRYGYLLAMTGALAILLSSVVNLWGLAAAGIVALGVGSASGLAARFAAIDLVRPERHARNIGMLIWATTLGAVAGPAIALGPVADLASLIGMESLTGTYLFIAVAFLGAALICERLRPDPLLTARRIAGLSQHQRKRPTLRQSLRRIVRVPEALMAVSAMSAGHFVMVAVMVMAPLHMREGQHELRIIGLAVSVHVIGMYAFSPLVGVISERFGSMGAIAAGGFISFIGAETTAYTPPENSLGMFVGLGLVGLGWSFCLIAGSSLLTSTVSVSDRIGVQGAADLLMNGSGALAGFAAGAIVGWQDFQFMSHYSGIITVVVGAIVTGNILLRRFGSRRNVL